MTSFEAKLLEVENFVERLKRTKGALLKKRDSVESLIIQNHQAKENANLLGDTEAATKAVSNLEKAQEILKGIDEELQGFDPEPLYRETVEAAEEDYKTALAAYDVAFQKAEKLQQEYLEAVAATGVAVHALGNITGLLKKFKMNRLPDNFALPHMSTPGISHMLFEIHEDLAKSAFSNRTATPPIAAWKKKMTNLASIGKHYRDTPQFPTPISTPGSEVKPVREMAAKK